MKKKKIVIFVMLIVFAFGVVVGYLGTRLSDYSTTLNANWDIELPAASRYSEQYSQTTGESFHGDGLRYHIFSYRNAEPIAEMCTWDTESGSTIFEQTYEEAVTEWLGRLGVPDEYLPDCSNCVFWYASRADHSEIVIMWNSTESKLYIAESFL